jgi:hypothetical protein
MLILDIIELLEDPKPNFLFDWIAIYIRDAKIRKAYIN